MFEVFSWSPGEVRSPWNGPYRRPLRHKRHDAGGEDCPRDALPSGGGGGVPGPPQGHSDRTPWVHIFRGGLRLGEEPGKGNYGEKMP